MGTHNKKFQIKHCPANTHWWHSERIPIIMHPLPPSPEEWHLIIGMRDTVKPGSPPPPQRHTQAEREANTKNAKRASSHAHTQTQQQQVERNSAKLIHTPTQGQTKHAWALKDKAACAVGQAAQATLRKRGAVWILFRGQDHTVTFSFTGEVLWSMKHSFNPASVRWRRCEHERQLIRVQPGSVERLRHQAKWDESYDTLIYESSKLTKYKSIYPGRWV